jgi:hypothetical protein
MNVLADFFELKSQTGLLSYTIFFSFSSGEANQ